MKEKEKSITIHGISEELNQKIQERSQEYHLSQNKTVKRVLEDALLKTKKKVVEERLKEFQDLFATWSKEELSEFEKNIEDNRTIDEEDWK